MRRPRWSADNGYSGPSYTALDGVIYIVHQEFPIGDQRRLTPSATCIPFATLEVAQTSAEDFAFMLTGYFRAVLLLHDIRQSGLTPELQSKVEAILVEDEKHMLGDSTG